MANTIYPLYKQALLQGDTGISLTTGTLKVGLLDTGTVSYSAAHQYYDDVSSGIVGTPQTIGSVTVSTDGTVDGADVTFTSVTGNTTEALVYYLDTGTPSTSRLVYWEDENVGATPNGGDINVVFNASGIFTL